MLPILAHHESVPPLARRAIVAAGSAAAGERDELLEEAARALHRETDLPCGDVRELVGLPPGTC